MNNLKEYRNKLFHESFEIKIPISKDFKKSQKVREQRNEKYQKSQFIKKLLIAKETIR